MEWGAKRFAEELEQIRKGDIDRRLMSVESYVQSLRKKRQDGKMSEQLREAVRGGVGIQIEKLRNDEADTYCIKRLIKRHKLREEAAAFRNAFKKYYIRHVADYIGQLKADTADYDGRSHWFTKNKKCADKKLQKKFEAELESYRERHGIKEREEIDKITEKDRIDKDGIDWKWEDEGKKALGLSVVLPFYMCEEKSGLRICNRVAKKYGGKIGHKSYTPEGMAEPLEEYWYLEISAPRKDLSEYSEMVRKAKDEMEKRVDRIVDIDYLRRVFKDK